MTIEAALSRPLRLIIPIMLALIAFASHPPASAGPDIIPIEGVNYNVNIRLTDNLRTLRGKRIHVTLNSGKDITGTIMDVGNQLIHLTKIEGREYFDALIRIESIDAIDTRFRNAQR